MNYVIVAHRKEGFSPLMYFCKESAEAAELFRWLQKCEELIGVELMHRDSTGMSTPVTMMSRGICD